MYKSSSLRPTMKDQTPEAANARLRTEVKDRWYVPDPNRATDLEKIRERALLKDFGTYRQAPQKKLRSFRLEAVRADEITPETDPPFLAADDEATISLRQAVETASDALQTIRETLQVEERPG